MTQRVDVLLTKSIIKLGTMGEIVSVAAGYARNYLLPYGFAIPADGATKKQVESLQKKAAAEAAANEQAALATKKTLDGLTIQVGAKVSHDDVLFGSVGVREIVEGLHEAGYEIESQQVNLTTKFKQLGTYEVPIKLYRSVEAIIKVEVVNSDPQGQALAEALADDTAADDAAE